jgi:prepilin-type N-terminal cleavage/methylation domain-containing protein
MKNKKNGFTLVELIVVITILIILSTIGFFNYKNYVLHSRDTVRISDITNMKSALEYTYLEINKFPVPD